SLAGVWSVDDVNLIVTAPNPDLKPEISNNYVGRLAYYFEPVGSFSLLFQQNEISNKGVQRRVTSAEFGTDDPAYAGYTFLSPAYAGSSVPNSAEVTRRCTPLLEI